MLDDGQRPKNPAIFRDSLEVTFTDSGLDGKGILNGRVGYQTSRCMTCKDRFTPATTKDVEELKQRLRMDCYKMSRGMFRYRVCRMQKCYKLMANHSQNVLFISIY
jgi:hypothetical protein